ncbi:response regulator transcription factor [Hydrogenophaga sp. PAMC20947]|uniref:response regulator transcription factor n=1 Tax=Hydrogenophaga sp. PAMC20947 TaxID=2565558 RepID=UPI00109E1EFF|nr:response regulator transcription factor [Hydrogenophaga sp. PAMC20947]QCB45678.1 response regulator transcription factor [Hydrogenophaga sp. PAMC20947]
MRILVAEDDSLIGDAVHKSLTRSGFAVDWVETGHDFRTAYTTHEYGCVVLDLGLPDDTGEALLAHTRCKDSRIPVIVVTARGSVRDKLALLGMGADDFMVKPFDLDELAARINAVLRRVPTGSAETNATTHGPLTLIPQRFLALWNGKAVTLTHREFWVLEALMRRKNQVLSRAQIEETLYGWGGEVESNAIEVYVHTLRRKFSAQLIHTIRGVGYQIAPVHQIEQMH